jgi:hypothetical protein
MLKEVARKLKEPLSLWGWVNSTENLGASPLRKIDWYSVALFHPISISLKSLFK